MSGEDGRMPRRVTLRMVYQFGSPNFRRQVLLTLLLILAGAGTLGAYRFYAVETPTAVEWITPANIIAIGGVLFSLGMLREQFTEIKRRLQLLEDFNKETLPETYARKDVMEARERI